MSIGPFRGRALAVGVHHLVATRELTAAMRQLRAATGDSVHQSADVLNETLARLYPDMAGQGGSGRYSTPHRVNGDYLSKVERGMNATLPVPSWLRSLGLDERSDAAQGSRVRPWLVHAYDVAFAADGYLIDMYTWTMALLADQQHNPPRVTRDLPGAIPAGGEDAYFADGFQTAPGPIREILREHARTMRGRRDRSADEPAWLPSDADLSGDTDDGDEINPEGVLVRPGEFRVARWLMRNVGQVPWRDRVLYRVGKPGTGIHTPRMLPLPDTEPGGTTEIRCPLRAPDRPGTYRICLKAGWPNGIYCHPKSMLGLIFTLIVPPADLAGCHEPWGSA